MKNSYKPVISVGLCREVRKTGVSIRTEVGEEKKDKAMDKDDEMPEARGMKETEETWSV